MKRAVSCAAVLLISLAAGCQRPPTYTAVPPPPPKSASVEVSGYQEGYRMGVKDVQHGRRFEVARHTPFQSPPVAQEDWGLYREAYTHGYRAAYGKEPLRPSEPVAQPELPPSPSSSDSVEDQGYQEGYRMGVLDIQQGREFAIARHTPFRYPQVTPDQADVYRNAYQYGYRVAYGMEPPPQPEETQPSQPVPTQPQQ